MAKRRKKAKKTPKRQGSSKRTLASLHRLYGTRALAAALSVSPSTVRRWKAGRIPESRLEAIQRLKQGPAEEHKRLLDMIAEGEQKRVIVRARTSRRHREGIRTGGYEATFAINAPFDELSLATAERLLRSFSPPKRFRIWLASAKLFELGHMDPIGYKTVQVLGAGSEAAFTVDEDIVTSGKQASKREAISRLLSPLHDLDPLETRILHSVYITTYFYLSDEQRRAREVARGHRRRVKRGKARK